MNVTELKMEMVEMISQTYDEQTVNRLYAKLQEAIEAESIVQEPDVTDESWWDEIPAKQQARILKSYKESFDPKNWIDHEEMKKRHTQWLTK